MNKAAEKAKCSGLSEEAEGHGRERSMPRGDGEAEKPLRAQAVCITAGSATSSAGNAILWDCFMELHHYQEPLRSVGVQVEMP